ncbi:MAG: hypothetical protein HY063_14360 [Bacteroidetes bacterium]|nr:hypothetical protein [Bacteroidota bacterium]
MKKVFFLLVILLLIEISCRKTKWKCDEDVSYANDIQPLFDAHCNKCHSWDSYAKAKQLADDGRLRAVTITERSMPPGGQKRLTLKERKKIYCWLEAGAPDN